MVHGLSSGWPSWLGVVTVSGAGESAFYPEYVLIARGLSRLEGQYVKSTGQLAVPRVLLQERLCRQEDASLLAPIHGRRRAAETRVRSRPYLHEHQAIPIQHDQVNFSRSRTIVAPQQPLSPASQPVDGNAFEPVPACLHCFPARSIPLGLQSNHWARISPPSKVARDNSRWRRNWGSMLMNPVLPLSRTSGPACNWVKRVCSRKASAPRALSRA